MSEIRVRETMEQIHISEEMQEQIIRNVRERMEGKNSAGEGRSLAERHSLETRGAVEKRHAMETRHTMKKPRTLESERDRRKAKRSISRDDIPFPIKKAAVAAVLVLAAGLAAIPVQAFVRSFVMSRMEGLPEGEVKDIARLVQEQKVEADSFSREFSDRERKRFRELNQLYGDGMFPEKTICLVEREEDMPEGIFCYVFETGYFNLPEREMTDEELLQIVDFNKLRNYALSQTQAGQEARREYLEKQEGMKEQVEAAGGIGREEAGKIALAQMESRLGAQAEGTKYSHVYFMDISKSEYAHKSDVAYVVVLRSAGGTSSYVCIIDAADGSILEEGENLPYARNILDE